MTARREAASGPAETVGTGVRFAARAEALDQMGINEITHPGGAYSDAERNAMLTGIEIGIAAALEAAANSLRPGGPDA